MDEHVQTTFHRGVFFDFYYYRIIPACKGSTEGVEFEDETFALFREFGNRLPCNTFKYQHTGKIGPPWAIPKNHLHYLVFLVVSHHINSFCEFQVALS